MSDLSNYLENAVINFFFRQNPGTITSPAAVYLELYTAVSDAEAGTGTECSFSGYAREEITFDAPSNGVTANGNEIVVTKGDAGTATITHGAIGDASSNGNRLTAIKALAASKALAQGDSIRFAAGAIDLTVA